jgi:hypothetical protein
LSRKAELLLKRLGLSYEHLLGMRFAVNVFIATTIVWFTLRLARRQQSDLGDRIDGGCRGPATGRSAPHVRCRFINVLVGCTVGFGMLLIGDRNDWMLPFALAVTVLISSYVVRIKTMWRQAPITAAIVLAAGISQGAKDRRDYERVAQSGGGVLWLHRGTAGELADVEGLARPATGGAGQTRWTAGAG